MAMCHEITFSNEKECLKGFARVYGNYPPRAPCPQWFDILTASSEHRGSKIRSTLKQAIQGKTDGLVWYPQFREWFDKMLKIGPKSPGGITILLRTEGGSWEYFE